MAYKWTVVLIVWGILGLTLVWLSHLNIRNLTKPVKKVTALMQDLHESRYYLRSVLRHFLGKMVPAPPPLPFNPDEYYSWWCDVPLVGMLVTQMIKWDHLCKLVKLAAYEGYITWGEADDYMWTGELLTPFLLKVIPMYYVITPVLIRTAVSRMMIKSYGLASCHTSDLEATCARKIVDAGFKVVRLKNPHKIMQKTLMLGKGSFGEVFTVPHSVYPSHVPLCIKIYKDRPDTPIKMLNAYLEALNLDKLRRVGGVPRTVAVCVDPPGLIMTQHATSTLHDMILCPPKDEVMLEVMRQVTFTLQQMHHLGFYHNDVKANNISAVITGDGKVDATLLDFGIMTQEGEPGPENFRKHYTQDLQKRKEYEQKRQNRYYWIAPELFHFRQSSSASDVFSVCQTLSRIHTVTRYDFSSKLNTLIEIGKSFEPDCRPSIGEINLCLSQEVESYNHDLRV